MVLNQARRPSLFRARVLLPLPVPNPFLRKKSVTFETMLKKCAKMPINTRFVVCCSFCYTFFRGQKSATKSVTRRKGCFGCCSFGSCSFSEEKSATALIISYLRPFFTMLHFFSVSNQIQFSEYFSLREKIAIFAK